MSTADLLEDSDSPFSPFCSDVSPPNSTSVFSNQSADAFARYIQRGGGYIGIHCASATAFSNPFYGRLVGAFFQYHPEIQPVGIKALNTDNPSTSRFPSILNIDEEVRVGNGKKEWSGCPRFSPHLLYPLVILAGLSLLYRSSRYSGKREHPLDQCNTL